MGVIYGSGIYFILGWDGDVSEDEALSRISKFCQNIGSKESERCWKCDSSDCVVKDCTYNMHIKFADRGSEEDYRFNNIQLRFDNEKGWIIEYHIDCNDIYMMRARSEFSLAERIAMWKVAQKVSDQLGMTDLTLRPIPYADVWNV